VKESLSITLLIFALTGCGGGGSSSSTDTPSIPTPTPDVVAPIITAPDSITVAAVDSSGLPASNALIVAFLEQASASDNVDAQVTVISDFPSVFPIGTSSVTFSAVDSAGNAAEAIIKTVTVTTSIVLNSNELYISEYSEGSESNRYVEIYNDSEDSLDLSDYAIAMTIDGADVESTWDIWTNFDISSNIESKSVFTICHQDISNLILADCDMLVDRLPDGNDGFALVKGNVGDFIVLDRVGDWAQDAPDTGWNVCGVDSATTDRTLVKKPVISRINVWSISAGTDADNCAWLVRSLDDWSNIGRHNTTGIISNSDAFEFLDSEVVLQDYDPSNQAVDFNDFDAVFENSRLNIDLRSAPLNLENIQNAVDGGDFQDSILKFPLNNALPSGQGTATVDMYITTGIDSDRSSDGSQIYCQLLLNWESNGVSASISEPEQIVALAVNKAGVLITTTIGGFNMFDLSPAGIDSTSSTLDIKLMSPISEAVKIAPELLNSLLRPRSLHIRMVSTLPFIDSIGAELTEINTIIRLK